MYLIMFKTAEMFVIFVQNKLLIIHVIKNNFSSEMSTTFNHVEIRSLLHSNKKGLVQDRFKYK